jgi:inorganic pyrophosphatase
MVRHDVPAIPLPTPSTPIGQAVMAVVLLPDNYANFCIVACAIFGALFAAFNTWVIAKIKVNPDDWSRGEGAPLQKDRPIYKKVHELMTYISDGATAFLFAEYRFMALFVLGMSGIIILLIGPTVEGWDSALFSCLAFIWGAATSVASGWIGMRIAVYTNGRTALMAARGYAEGFVTAFRGGIVMGFALTSLGLLNLFLGIIVFKLYFKDQQIRMFGCIAAYGLRILILFSLHP